MAQIRENDQAQRRRSTILWSHRLGAAQRTERQSQARQGRKAFPVSRYKHSCTRGAARTPLGSRSELGGMWPIRLHLTDYLCTNLRLSLATAMDVASLLQRIEVLTRLQPDFASALRAFSRNNKIASALRPAIMQIACWRLITLRALPRWEAFACDQTYRPHVRGPGLPKRWSGALAGLIMS